MQTETGPKCLSSATPADSSTWHACNHAAVARVIRVTGVASVAIVVVHAVTESWPRCLYLDAVRQLPAVVALRCSLLSAACLLSLLPLLLLLLAAPCHGLTYGIKFL